MPPTIASGFSPKRRVPLAIIDEFDTTPQSVLRHSNGIEPLCRQHRLQTVDRSSVIIADTPVITCVLNSHSDLVSDKVRGHDDSAFKQDGTSNGQRTRETTFDGAPIYFVLGCV